MQQDETTVETQDEKEEGQTPAVEEIVVEETEAAPETPEITLAEAKAEAAKYRRLFEKSQKPKPATAAAPQVSPTNVEETVLLVNGMSEELLAELKTVAAVRKVSLIKAQNDPIFVAVKEKFEKDKKQKDASLGAARGAGTVKPKKDFNTPGLSREDHRNMVIGA